MDLAPDKSTTQSVVITAEFEWSDQPESGSSSHKLSSKAGEVEVEVPARSWVAGKKSYFVAVLAVCLLVIICAVVYNSTLPPENDLLTSPE